MEMCVYYTVLLCTVAAKSIRTQCGCFGDDTLDCTVLHLPRGSVDGGNCDMFVVATYTTALSTVLLCTVAAKSIRTEWKS